MSGEHTFLNGIITKTPWRPASVAPDRAGRVFYIMALMRGEEIEILTTDTHSLYETAQSVFLKFGTPEEQWRRFLANGESLDSDWLEQPNDGTKRWRILAWAWEEEANAYFMGLFYRTPQPVLDYIDTWNETGKETKTPFTILH